MGKKNSSGTTIRTTTECGFRSASDRMVAAGLPQTMDAICKELDSKQNLQGAAVPPATGAVDECVQNLEFSNEDECALNEVRLELLRRKELALLELKKIIAETSKGYKTSKKTNMKS